MKEISSSFPADTTLPQRESTGEARAFGSRARVGCTNLHEFPSLLQVDHLPVVHLWPALKNLGTTLGRVKLLKQQVPRAARTLGRGFQFPSARATLFFTFIISHQPLHRRPPPLRACAPEAKTLIRRRRARHGTLFAAQKSLPSRAACLEICRWLRACPWDLHLFTLGWHTGFQLPDRSPDRKPAACVLVRRRRSPDRTERLRPARRRFIWVGGGLLFIFNILGHIMIFPFISDMMHVA